MSQEAGSTSSSTENVSRVGPARQLVEWVSSQITLLASMNAEMKSLWPDEVRLKIRPERLEVESCKADRGVQLVTMESVGNEIQFDSGARRCSPNGGAS